MIFEQIKSSDMSLAFMTTLIKFSLLLILPYFSYFYLKMNYKNLEKQEFKNKFETLYTNMYPLNTSVY